jgi:hypothetical protein
VASVLEFTINKKKMEKQTENTKFIIQRYDNYIAGANVKGNFLLAFNSFLTGGIIANYSKMTELISDDCGITLLNIVLSLLIIASIITTVFVINAVYPYLISGNSSKDSYHSHIFFNSVSEFESDKIYHDSLSKLSDNDFDKDLSHQAYQLSKGLKSKYHNLKWAMRFVYFELFCIFSIIILIIIF